MVGEGGRGGSALTDAQKLKAKVMQEKVTKNAHAAKNKKQKKMHTN